MSEEKDDLNEILAPTQGQPRTGLREALLRQTETRLARQRWVRKSVRTAVVGVVFLLGGLTGWLVKPSPLIETATQPPEAVLVPVIVPLPIPIESVSSGTQQIAQQLSGSEAELQAEQVDDLKEAAKLYKLAGDAFLREQDYPNSSRCYRLFLVRGGDAALSLNPDDSWLLTSLKNAAFQEKSRVQKTAS